VRGQLKIGKLNFLQYQRIRHGPEAHVTIRFNDRNVMPMNRRELLAATSATAAFAIATRVLADWEPSQRYPDPLVKIVDPSFGKYRVGNAKVERIAAGMRWCEGPSGLAMGDICSGATSPTTPS
jgi:hypothetical protein